MAAKPTLIYTWALSGTATEPTVGKKASGWAVGERPPRATENWLNQANGAWITYLDGVFTNYSTVLSVGTEVGTQIALGNNRARLRVDEYPGALGITDVSLRVDSIFGRFSVQGVRTGRLEINDPAGLNTDVARLELSSDSPESGLDTFVEFNTDGGNPCYVRAHAFAPLGTANDIFTANVMPLDQVVCRGNYAQAAASVIWTRASGTNSALTVTGYNIASVASPSNGVLEIQLTDFTSGLVGVPHVSIVARNALGTPFYAYALNSTGAVSYNSATGLITVNIVGEETGTGNMLAFGAPTNTHNAQIFVVLY